MPPKPPGGVAVLLLRDDRVLLGLRAPGKAGARTWAPPGGKADPKESVEACARRELREETGLSVDTLQAVGLLSDRFSDGRPWETVFLIAEWAGGEPQVREPDACVAWRWFPVAHLPAPLFRPFDLMVALAEWPLRVR